MGRSSDAKDRLVGSAIELMRCRSYADVGVNDVCEAAGVKKGSFYHFFSSKRDLTIAAIDEQWRWMRDNIIDPALRADIPPLQRLEQWVGKIYELNVQVKATGGQLFGCPFGNLAIELSTIEEEIRCKLSCIFREWINLITDTLAAAVEAGDLPADTDAPALAEALMAFVEGAMTLAKMQNDPEVMRRLAPYACRLMKGEMTCGFNAGAGLRAASDEPDATSEPGFGVCDTGGKPPTMT